MFSDTRHDNFAGLKPSSHLQQRSRWPHETAATAATAAQLADETDGTTAHLAELTNETAITAATAAQLADETDGTTARLADLTNETAITAASPERPINPHFPRAKVSPVSNQHPPTPAKASPVSSRRSDALETEPMHQVAQHYTGS